MANFNRQYGTKGYKVVANTSATAHNFYGIQVLAEAVINTIVAPTAASPEGTAYDGDESGMASKTLPAGAFYPLRGSSITLTSGTVILYTE